MKKQYDMPTAERIAFDYREQVVATSGAGGQGGNRNMPFWSCVVDPENLTAAGLDICSWG